MIVGGGSTAASFAKIAEDRERVHQLAEQYGIEPFRMVHIIQEFSQVIGSVEVAIIKISELLRALFHDMTERLPSLVELLEHEQLGQEKCYNHRIDFKRPRVRHQVTCRKPTLVRKIIH
ncbi:hypothetical protein [Lysinibacillus sp. 54212]|uniref:hypothetical protein n=1 Tax=Lysinibacillus sp. 54212 TaxID=3119829 RepID=UPI002FCBB55A